MDFNFQQAFLNRFLRYAAVPTGSDSSTGTHPSTHREFDLAHMLKNELEEMGLQAEVSEFCYVYALFNAGKRDRICLVAHLDTSEEAPNSVIRPMEHVFNGGDIELLNDIELLGTDLKAEGCLPGDVLVTSDGTTLLGGDDKAGIAIIMTLLEYLGHQDCSQLPELSICFTPDEEIGEGVDNIDMVKLKGDNALFALTIDGANHHEISVETFSAKAFNITIAGFNTHPGDAYGKMINAVEEASKLVCKLAECFRAPEQSRDRENYLLVSELEGGITQCVIKGIIRSFDEEDIAQLQKQLVELINQFEQESSAKIKVEVHDEYKNMAKYITQGVKERVLKCGERFKSRVVETRGGTDGSRLSEMGLQTPNIWDGAFWFHSVKEVVNVRESVDAIHFLLLLLKEE